MGKGDRKRRAGSRAVRAARASTVNRTPLIIGAVVVLILAAAVVGGVLVVGAQKASVAAAPIAAVTSAPDSLAVSVDRNAATVLVGSGTAKVTVDLYEDFLCPVCRQFEQSYVDQIDTKLTAGAIRVRYHMVNLLDSRSDPPGYSLRAANAALAVADVAPSRFLDFHDSLYGAQPPEGGRGYDNGQLVDLGRRLGIADARFADQVTGGSLTTQIQQSLKAAVANPALQRPSSTGGKSFGTSAVAVNGALVDTSNPTWLDTVVASPASS